MAEIAHKEYRRKASQAQQDYEETTKYFKDVWKPIMDWADSIQGDL